MFDDMVSNIEANEKLSSIASKLFMGGRKLNISFFFFFFFSRQSFFKVPKDIRLNATYYFIMKIPNERAFQQITLNHFSYIEIIKLYEF